MSKHYYLTDTGLCSASAVNSALGRLYNDRDRLRAEIKEELKEIKETLQLIVRFLGEDYIKLKEEESHLLEKDD